MIHKKIFTSLSEEEREKINTFILNILDNLFPRSVIPIRRTYATNKAFPDMRGLFIDKGEINNLLLFWDSDTEELNRIDVMDLEPFQIQILYDYIVLNIPESQKYIKE